MISSIAAVVAAGTLAAGTSEVRLQKIQPDLGLAGFQAAAYQYDKALGEDQAKRIHAGWLKTHKSNHAIIAAVPGEVGLVLLADDVGAPEGVGTTERGRRLFLLRQTESGFEELDHTPGAGDSYILVPIFFTGDGRTFVFAEMATDYAWGYNVYEVLGGKLQFLGPLDVNMNGPQTPISATKHLSAKLAGGALVAEFDVDCIVADPKAPSGYRTVPYKKGRPIAFRWEGEKGFVRLP